MHIMPVPEDAESVWPADPALIPHTPTMCTRDSEGPRVPMTPGDPVPEKLMGLRMSWINKLEKKTEKVIRVMNMQDSPEKEHELERRLQEIKQEEESLSELHKDLLESFAHANRSDSLDCVEIQTQEVAMMQQQLLVLQSALEDEKACHKKLLAESKKLEAQFEDESAEAARLRASLLHVQESSRAIQDKAAAVELQGRQQQMREEQMQQQLHEVQSELLQAQTQLVSLRHKLGSALSASDDRVKELENAKAHLETQLTAARDECAKLQVQMDDTLQERDMWMAQVLEARGEAEAQRSEAYFAHDTTKETEREYRDFQLNHDSQTQYSSCVLKALGQELQDALADLSAVRAGVDSMEKEAEEVKQEMVQASTAMIEAQEHMFEAEVFQRTSMQQLAELQRSLDVVTQEKAQVQQQLVESVVHAQEVQDALNNSTSQLIGTRAQHESRCKEFECKLGELQAQLAQGRAAQQRTSENFQQEIDAALAEVNELSARVREKNDLLVSTRRDLSAATANADHLTAELAAAHARIGRFEKEATESEVCRVGLQVQILKALEGRAVICKAASDEARQLAALVGLAKSDILALHCLAEEVNAAHERSNTHGQTQIQSLSGECSALATTVARLEKEGTEANDKALVLEARVESLRIANAELETLLQAAQAAADAGEKLHHANEAVHADIVAKMRQEQLAEKELMETEMTALVQELERLNALVGAKDLQIRELKRISQELHGTESALSRMQEQLLVYQQRTAQLDQDKQRLSDQNRDLERDKSTMSVQMSSANAELESLKRGQTDAARAKMESQAQLESVTKALQDCQATLEFEVQTLSYALEKDRHCQDIVRNEQRERLGSMSAELASTRQELALEKEQLVDCREMLAQAVSKAARLHAQLLSEQDHRARQDAALERERQAACTEREVLVTELNGAMSERDQAVQHHAVVEKKIQDQVLSLSEQNAMWQEQEAALTRHIAVLEEGQASHALCDAETREHIESLELQVAAAAGHLAAAAGAVRQGIEERQLALEVTQEQLARCSQQLEESNAQLEQTLQQLDRTNQRTIKQLEETEKVFSAQLVEKQALLDAAQAEVLQRAADVASMDKKIQSLEAEKQASLKALDDIETRVNQREKEMVQGLQETVSQVEVDARQRLEAARHTADSQASQQWQRKLDQVERDHEEKRQTLQQECDALRQELATERASHADQAARDEALMRMQHEVAAKGRALAEEARRVQAEAAAKEHEVGAALHNETALLESLDPLPTELISTLHKIVAALKQERLDVDLRLTRSKRDKESALAQVVTMHEALVNSDLLLAEAEEYSAQLEQRLQAALQWRLEVEQQVQQQSGEKEALHQQLQMLKTRLDLSPGATPSKPLAKVEALKGEVKCALDRLRVESEANAEERARRHAAEEDLGSMRQDLARMQHALQQRDLAHQQERTAAASEREVAGQLRQQLESQVLQMKARLVVLQQTIDDHQAQEAARVQVGRELVVESEGAVQDSDETIATIRQQLDEVMREKAVTDAHAQKMQEHLDSVNAVLAQENERTRECKAIIQQLSQDKSALAASLASLQAQYQEACVKLLGDSPTADGFAAANLSHISVDNVTPPPTNSKGTLPAARHSGVHELSPGLSFDWDRSVDSADRSPEQVSVMQTGAKMLRRLTAEKERLANAVDTLQEALQQELSRRQALVQQKGDLEFQLQQERQLAMQEKQRLIETTWAEKQALLRAMDGLTSFPQSPNHGSNGTDAPEIEAELRDRISRIRGELCQDRELLTQELQRTRHELECLRSLHTSVTPRGQEAWEAEKAALTQRVRELEARAAAAGRPESAANDGTVRHVMEAVGSGCSEATARRLLTACNHDCDKAVMLAQQALQALHKSWDQIDVTRSPPSAQQASKSAAAPQPPQLAAPKMAPVVLQVQRASAPAQTTALASAPIPAAAAAGLVQPSGETGTPPSAGLFGKKTWFSHLLPASGPLSRRFRRSSAVAQQAEAMGVSSPYTGAVEIESPGTKDVSSPAPATRLEEEEASYLQYDSPYACAGDIDFESPAPSSEPCPPTSTPTNPLVVTIEGLQTERRKEAARDEVGDMSSDYNVSAHEQIDDTSTQSPFASIPIVGQLASRFMF